MIILGFLFDRKIEAIEDILSENFDPQFNEVDVLGVVINIGNLNNQGKYCGYISYIKLID